MANLDLIKQRIDIVELVGQYVQLKKAGTNWKGLCPFHNEKSPSFMVSETKQMFHCFGCSAGGDIFEFIKKMEGVEFKEAMILLAKKAGITLEYQSPGQENRKNRLYDILEESTQFFENALRQNNAGADFARNYIATKRGLTDQTTRHFRIGYAPDSWSDLCDFLATKKFSAEEILESGMGACSEKTGRVYDRFRNRVAFPIFNPFGNIIGFSARVLNPERDKMGKYINSPETPTFHKGSVLYGLFQAKDAIKEKKSAILVEGQVDVIACHQAGFRNVVAASGTALTQDHLKILARYTDTLYLCFDSDKAGQMALLRSAKIVLPGTLAAKVITLPAGKDPDELIQKNPALFQEGVTAAKSLLDHYFHAITTRADFGNAAAKEKSIRFLLKILTLSSSAIQKEYYLEKISHAFGISGKSLNEESKKINAGPKIKPSVTPPAAAAVSPQKITPQEKKTSDLLDRVLGLWLSDWLETPRPPLPEEYLKFDFYPKTSLYKRISDWYSAHNSNNLADFTKTLPPEEHSIFQKLTFLGDEYYGHFQNDSRSKEWQFLSTEIKKIALSRELDTTSKQLFVAEAQKDAEKIQQLLVAMNGLHKQMSSLK
ncbi:MAG: DNA primase [Parcubacteria group bacterium Gr01-1014_18]|nr:MAG: DNA primase [Parcubacteria group bacterium Greene0416_36]TSC80717.1 MAG: DNA primase [Parcubacteria group bacterium Gr01-1014_18]TSC98672.1 MAG: DNA primase [Parcubacteria group bacterium Greene1014_20]TSD07168.1 MAG: DNA primase [Parcubacteria group bacterium Greene0714_2]